MIIIFNWVGVGIFLFSALVAAPFALLLGKTGTMVACGILMIALDLGYRMKFGEGQILHPRRGGAFYYIPVWILGGVWIVACLCEAGHNGQQVSARESWQPTQVSAAAVPQGVASRRSSAPANQFTYASEPQSDANSHKVLKLGMISGVGVHRIATVNSQPFAEGESHKLNVGSAKLAVQCLEIRDQSVVVKVSGDPHPREIRLGKPLTLTP